LIITSSSSAFIERLFSDLYFLVSAIASFSFGKPDASQNFIESKSSSEDNIFPSANAASSGEYPTIEDESFSIKRGYQFKPSAIRKLYELKTLHPNVDVYLNIILDEAIQHFYNYIVNEKGSFSNGKI
jgi:hypothetical protein